MSRGDSDFSSSREDNNQQAAVGTVVNDGKKEKGVNQGQGASSEWLFWFFEFIYSIKRHIVDATADQE